MEFIIDQLITWWQFTVVGILIIIGLIVNMFGVDCKEDIIGFKYRVMPQLRPIAIPTAGKGFWGAVWMWLTGVRTWEVADDWAFKINRDMIFNTEIECVEYLETYNQYVKAGIKRSFPNLNLLDIRCIDIETAKAMQEQMRSKK